MAGASCSHSPAERKGRSVAWDLKTAPLLLCRTGSMTLFDGDLRTWWGGHSHPRDTGEAWEAWNFTRTTGGYVYGYVQNARDRGLNISRLKAARGADRVEGVTVVWCSRRPSDGKLTIHGWYENAIVFRSSLKRPDGKRFGASSITAYFMTVAGNANLLPPAERTHVLPSNEENTMGRSDILYVDQVNPALASGIRGYLLGARDAARQPSPGPGTPPDQRGWGGGESPQHLALKLYVRDNPTCLKQGIKKRGEEEYVLPSLDGVDVLFREVDRLYAVEVKPRNCGESEHLRGLYQCVKYRALLEAEASDTGSPVPCTAILVTEDPLSEGHRATASRLEIIHRRVRLPSAHTR
jgi:hypothetical protein